MKEVMRKFEQSPIQLIVAAFTLGLVAVSVPHADAGAAESRWGNPCDTRDTCSADPAKHAAYRDNGQIKAREYVAEMRWGTGGAPDDAYIITKTVGSRDFADAKPCHVRDACIGGQAAYKVVRSGPSGTEMTTAAQSEGVKVANEPAKK